MFTTHPYDLSKLLDEVHSGRMQLPDFQRGWVWDDDRIKDLLVSVSRSFPIGAIMTLSADCEFRFQRRMIEGAPENQDAKIESYLLDGQQRMTSLYQTLVSPNAVDTKDRPGGNRTIKRWYFLDMQATLDSAAAPEDIVVSMPESKKESINTSRHSARNLSTPDLEFQNHMMPTGQVMRNAAWGFRYTQYWNQQDKPHPHGDAFEFFEKFQEAVLDKFTQYEIPVINLDRDTSKEAVCTVFEKVNTGGVTLSVFELLTASLAANDFNLRTDWESRQRRMCERYGLLQSVGNTYFLQAVALLATQERPPAQPTLPIGAAKHHPSRPSCKKADILSLTREEYEQWAPKVEAGFIASAAFLHTQFIFTQQDVPYNTQLVPLAALHVELEDELNTSNAMRRLEQWYWCGVLGETYSGPVETLYPSDLAEVPEYIRHGTVPRSIQESSIVPERLISLRSRNSAAYKGLYALQMKSQAADWRTGQKLAMDIWRDQSIDIHHIFPVNWCERRANPRVPKHLYDSIINKTPIDAATNRRIGGRAPSQYLRNLAQDNDLLDDTLRSHWLDPESLRDDDFSECFIQRGNAMLELISQAMGKPAADGTVVLTNALRQAGIIADDNGESNAASNTRWAEEDDEPEFDAIGSSIQDDEGTGNHNGITAQPPSDETRMSLPEAEAADAYDDWATNPLAVTIHLPDGRQLPISSWKGVVIETAKYLHETIGLDAAHGRPVETSDKPRRNVQIATGIYVHHDYKVVDAMRQTIKMISNHGMNPQDFAVTMRIRKNMPE